MKKVLFPIGDQIYRRVLNTAVIITLSAFLIKGVNRVHSYIKSSYKLQPEIYEKIENSYDLGKDGVLLIKSESFNTYNELFNYLGEITGLGKVLKAVAFTESNFNPFAKSHADAYGIMQVKKIAYKEVIRLYHLSKRKLEKYDVKNVYVCDPSNLTTFKTILKINKPIQPKEIKEVRYIYAPFFLLVKHLYPYGFPEWEKVKYNAIDNAKIGTLYFYYLYLKYGHIQAIKDGKNIRYVRRDPSFFEKHGEKYRLIPKEYLWILYNLGPTRIRMFEKRGIGTLYSLIRGSPRETKNGLKKIHKYLYDPGNYSYLLNQSIHSSIKLARNY